MTRVRFAILGSCVTRDAFATLHTSQWVVARYMARTHLGSCFGVPTRLLHPDWDSIPSAFQRRTVRDDVEKRSPAWLQSGGYDVLVLDSIDDRFAVGLLSDGGTVTLSNEFAQLGLPEASHRTAEFGSRAHWDLWVQGWEAMVALLSETDALGRLVVHQAPWAPRRRGSWRATNARRDEAARANAWLERAWRRMALDLPADQFVAVSPRHVLSDPDHRWGDSPFHYVPDYYGDLLARLAHTRPVRLASSLSSPGR